MILRLITPPVQEPLDQAEAKLHLRVDGLEEDVRIWHLIKAARQQMEGERGVALITQTWELGLPGFPSCGIVLPRPPLQSVTSVSYVDQAGVTQTWGSTSYTVVNASGPKARRARIVPVYGQFYPSTQGVPEAVTVRFVAGFGASPMHVPEPLRQALLLHIGELYRDREMSTVGTIVTRQPTYDRLVQSCVEIAA